MTKNQKVVAVKSAFFLLKCAVNPVESVEEFLLNALGEGLDVTADYVTDQIQDGYLAKGAKVVHAILTDPVLEQLYVPQAQYDLVRHSICDMMQQSRIDVELLESCQYDVKKAVKTVIDVYQKEHPMDFESRQVLYLENGLQKIMDVLIKEIAAKPDTVIGLLQKMEHISDTVQVQGTELERMRYQVQELQQEFKAMKIQQKQSSSAYQLRPDMKKAYADRWTERMFLHRDDDNDRNQNITLKNIYQLPSYKMREDDCFDLHHRLEQFVSETEYEKRMLLVLGQPGSGKSTLITYLLNKCIANCDREILVYQFAKLKQVDWASDPKQALLNALRADDVTDFSGKVLILDGFDEISVGGSRERILDRLYDDIAMDYSVEDFSLLITCREHYITGKTKCDQIFLNPFTEQQIGKFCSTYWNAFGVTKEDPEALQERFCEKKAIMGIPLLLYMTLTLDITIEKDTSYVDIYDKIFAIDGGIYDRCITILIKNEEIRKYFEASHRVAGEMKQQLHRISKEIALYMLEYEPETASIPKEAYEQIVECVQREELKIIERNIPISFYLKKIAKQIDGVDTEQLKFIHRSMYEYFVAVAVCDEIVDQTGRLIQQGNEREMINRLTLVLCRRQFSDDSKQYLEYRVQKHIFANNQASRDQCADWWRKVSDTMLAEGIVMKEVPFWDCAEKQAIGFLNFIPLMRGILAGCKQKCPYQIGSVERIGKNIRNANTMENRYDEEIIDLAFINLIRADLRGVDSRRADLRGADLINADLRGVDLRRADLRGADLINADLRGADLNGTDLNGTYLNGAYLIRANLIRAHLIGAHLSGADLRGADLREANLSGAGLSGADLRGADLREANLSGAGLSGADLRGADLREANLSGAGLSGADLRGADLREANLSGAGLSEADFTDANVEGANFTDAIGIESCIGLDLT